MEMLWPSYLILILRIDEEDVCPDGVALCIGNASGNFCHGTAFKRNGAEIVRLVCIYCNINYFRLIGVVPRTHLPSEGPCRGLVANLAIVLNEQNVNRMIGLHFSILGWEQLDNHALDRFTIRGDRAGDFSMLIGYTKFGLQGEVL